MIDRFVEEKNTGTRKIFNLKLYTFITHILNKNLYLDVLL